VSVSEQQDAVSGYISYMQLRYNFLPHG